MKILANVLFDESHANAWSIRPGMPERMNPANPGDASYEQAAELLRHRGHAVTAQVDGEFTDARPGVVLRSGRDTETVTLAEVRR